ncbi:Fluoroquinolones export permease protein [Paenibacillus sp. CECT 9249]|uniref:hypothetical protein n=1 Tax=Paenibacillus sp. CECT 9249 TaxID=2845385 RepID=UPI001E438B96|nr:hypothetical protein [Paenibacillus sp. CECT 9249]CAH0119326.1 Fluoroquinolones export permease protein [Paenibacillus sp. CECT 9249]
MNRFLHLIRGDVKQIARDPMLAFYLLAPMLIILAVRFGIPFVAALLQREAGFDLAPYYNLILSFAMLLIPLILGVLAGFMMLDERDENLIAYYSVTPLSKSGYLLYRLSFPIVLSVLYCGMFLLAASLAPAQTASLLATLPMLAMEAPLIALLLAACASNKVEGLAWSKGAGLIVFLPAIAYFVPLPWQLLAGIVPAYWVPRTFLASGMTPEALTIPVLALCGVTGIAVHVIALRFLYQRFLLKTD